MPLPVGEILPTLMLSAAETVKARTHDEESAGFMVFHTPGNSNLGIALYNLSQEQLVYILRLMLAEIKEGARPTEVNV